MSNQDMLNMAGERVAVGPDAVYMLELYEPATMVKRDKDYIVAGILKGQKTFCHNTISGRYINNSLKNITYVMKLSLISLKGGKLPVGFALVQDRGATYYVDVLCAETSEVAKRQSQRPTLKPSPGSVLLAQVGDFAKRQGATRLELSALPYVVNYYRTRGFRHIYKHDTEERPEIRAAAEVLSNFQFTSTQELNMVYKIGAAEILSSGRADMLVTLLGHGFPQHKIREEPDGRVVADHLDGTVDEALTYRIENRDVYADLVEAFMHLKTGKFHKPHPTSRDQYTPVWKRQDRLTGVDYDTFTMVKQLGGGARRRRRTTIRKTTRKRRTTRKPRKQRSRRPQATRRRRR